MNFSIIMPMFNTKNIKENLDEVVKSMNKFDKDYEIILVNDGSTNNCFNEAKEFRSKKVKVVGYEKNQGKGMALKHGFRIAQGKYIVFLDCDGDLNPKQIKYFYEIMKKDNADIVIGSKRHPDSKLHYPLIRKIMSGCYQLLNKILFNLNIKDTQVGLKMFKREVLEKIMPRILVKRFAFDLELLVIANKFHFKIVEAPVTINFKFQSTINSKSVFWTLWDTAAIFYRLKILRWYDKNGK